MAFLSSLDISGSALKASRLRMDVISENIANASTTRTDAGGPYRRKMVVYHAEDSEGDSFGSLLNNELSASSKAPGGVRVDEIVEDQTPFTTVYDPSSPDADAQGYVQKPNVDVTKETLDMMSVTRAYSANINAFNAVKSMASKALEMGK
ncbi:flagellar basal body rod protein FlgC [Caproicibacter sp.]|uniref:flagellar basal body rod protein FlgC n=1 Tax=Caproicibacter sp. TaxID=2814884 RepID=UPI0039892AA7